MERLPCSDCSLDHCNDCPHPIETSQVVAPLQKNRPKKNVTIEHYRPKFNKEENEQRKRYY